MCNSSLNELRTRGQNLFIYSNHNFLKIIWRETGTLEGFGVSSSFYVFYKNLKKKKNYKLSNHFQNSIFPRGLFSR